MVIMVTCQGGIPIFGIDPGVHLEFQSGPKRSTHAMLILKDFFIGGMLRIISCRINHLGSVFRMGHIELSRFVCETWS
jgi:hypothetical protein